MQTEITSLLRPIYEDHIQSLLGIDFTGTVMCDRAKMYLGFQFIQWCWAHLRRDFIALSDTDPSINDIGQELVDLTDEMFYYWHLFRGGTLTRGGLQESIAELRVRVEDALARGTSRLTYGTQSAAGSRFVETPHTILETCRTRPRRVGVHH